MNEGSRAEPDKEGSKTARLSGELRAFFELARAVAQAPYDVSEMLERICAEVRAVFGFQRAMLVRYDPQQRTVHAVVQHNVAWPGDEWLWIDKFPFLERALEENRAVFVRDPRDERAMPGKVAERFGVSSIVAVPLSIEARCLGFLVFDNAGAELELTDGDLELLTTLGWVAAVFIDKAEHYAELERSHEELRNLDSLKGDFISIASHELRTPIAVVHGIASTLHLRGNELASSQLDELRETLYGQT